MVAKFDAVTLRRTLQDRQSELRQAQAELDQAREQAKLDRGTGPHGRDQGGLRRRARQARPRRSGRLVRHGRRAHEARARRRAAAARRSASDAIAPTGRRRKRTWARGSERSPRSAATSSRPSAALGSLQVTAPADGTVSIMPNFRASSPMGPAQEFRAGDRAWPGAQILELPDLTSIHLASRIDEADRGQLKSGQSATIRVDAVPDREYQGTIADISMLARVDFSSGWPPSKNFDLKLSIKDADTKIKPGHERRRAHRGRQDARPAARSGRRRVHRRRPIGRVSPHRPRLRRDADRHRPPRRASRSRSSTGSSPGDRLALTRPDGTCQARQQMTRRRLRRLERRSSVLVVAARRSSRSGSLGFERAVECDRAGGPLIPTTRITRGPLELSVNATGEVRAAKSAMLPAPSVGGTLRILKLAPTGTTVKTGDVIVELDPTEQIYALEQAQVRAAAGRAGNRQAQGRRGGPGRAGQGRAADRALRRPARPARRRGRQGPDRRQRSTRSVSSRVEETTPAARADRGRRQVARRSEQGGARARRGKAREGRAGRHARPAEHRQPGDQGADGRPRRGAREPRRRRRLLLFRA